MVDQRRSKRFKIHQLINISFGKEDFLSCEALNLSETGMLIKVNNEMDYHTRFYIVFEIPLVDGETHEISCDANVVHSKKVEDQYEVGIAFNIIRPKDKQLLNQYFEMLSKA